MTVMKRNEIDREFDKMLKENMGIILSICATFTDRKTDKMKDLYQDIVCRLWEGWGKFRNDSKVSTWVYRVALNTAISHKRHTAAAPAFVRLDDTLLEQIAEPPPNEFVDQLYRLIKRLDEKDKAIIYLYLDNLSIQAISETLELSPNTVKHEIHRIKIKLKEMNDHENNR